MRTISGVLLAMRRDLAKPALISSDSICSAVRGRPLRIARR